MTCVQRRRRRRLSESTNARASASPSTRATAKYTRPNAATTNTSDQHGMKLRGSEHHAISRGRRGDSRREHPRELARAGTDGADALPQPPREAMPTPATRRAPHRARGPRGRAAIPISRTSAKMPAGIEKPPIVDRLELHHQHRADDGRRQHAQPRRRARASSCPARRRTRTDRCACSSKRAVPGCTRRA